MRNRVADGSNPSGPIRHRHKNNTKEEIKMKNCPGCGARVEETSNIFYDTIYDCPECTLWVPDSDTKTYVKKSIDTRKGGSSIYHIVGSERDLRHH